MKNYIKFLSVLLFLGITALSFASRAATESKMAMPRATQLTELPNVNKGNWAVGGDFGAGYSTTYSQGSLYVNPTAEYFVIDRLSIGGVIQSSFSSDYTNIGIGPSATWHYWQSDRWTATVGLSAVYSEGNYKKSSFDYSSWTGTAKLGANYFITPSVSFGPFLSHQRNIKDFDPNGGFTSLLFQFSIFL